MKKRRFIILALLFAMSLMMVQSLMTEETYQAAISYTNAKEFYESTGLDGKPYHAEMINGTIYYATSAKLASSSTNLKYHTVGFDITLSGNGHSVSFTVQRTGGSMEEVDSRKDGKKEYILYAIRDKKLYELADKANSTDAGHVLKASVIDVKMNAILVTKQGNSLGGGITEDGSGGFEQSGTIYRLKNESDLKDLKEIFTGHKFESYTNILERLPNHQLQIRYNAQGLNSTSSTTATAGNGYSVKDGFVAKNGNAYIQKQRVLQQTTLLNPADISLQKEGYHLSSGKEWITKNGRNFTPSDTYMPKTIEPLVGSQDKGITMYANWSANKYTINYDANGGNGKILPANMTYDVESDLANNTFTRRGYYLPEGKEWMDADGNTYKRGQRVSNLTAKDKDTIVLYANWEPGIYKITLDNENAGDVGTTEYYEKYDNGNYADSSCLTAISQITVPAKTGYTFRGYYTSKNGAGTCYISEDGTILSENNTFYSDTTLFAYWEPNTYTIKYDANGGTGTIADSPAVYDAITVLRINSFTNTGHTFVGWATEPDGESVYANRAMVSNLTAVNGGEVTLYAVWEPLVVYIGLDPQGGSGGADSFYEKYGIGFYSDRNSTSSISKLSLPGKTGYTFRGYFEKLGSMGVNFVNPSGRFLIDSKYFLTDSIAFADWKPNTYTLTLDKQGGEHGSDSVKVTYDSVLPTAEAPVRAGYSFKGYYTKTNGKGTMYYNEHMASDVVYKQPNDMTVYAYWVDEEPPVVKLKANSSTWTKSKITLTAEASDLGTGLKSIVIYVLDSNGNATAVKSNTSLNGAKSASLSYDNPTEGAIRYKAVATDVSGKTSESYFTVYYDKTAPNIRENQTSINGNTFYFDLDISDIKPQ